MEHFKHLKSMVRYQQKSYLITYASTFLGQITTHKIIEEADYRKKDLGNPRWEVLIAKEEADVEIHREHFHCYWNWISTKPIKPNITSEKYWDIPLPRPIVSFMGKDSKGNRCVVAEAFYEDFFSDDDIEEYCQSHGYEKWTLIKDAHPNIEPITKGTDARVLRYCIKQQGDIWSDFDYDERLKYLDSLVKQKTKKSVTKQKREPDWSNMKKNGWTLDQVLEFIKEEFPKEMINNYYKWSSGIHMVFGASKKVNFEINYEKTYWVPNKYLDWVKNELKPFVINRNNPEWINRNRHTRPKSLIWIGPTQIGKTSVVRSTCDNNYYQFGFDGMEDFECNKPVTILDDFAKKVTSFLPGWKCWLGSQTDFTINPKYGRRRRVEWGHPCIFLNNNNILDKTVSEFSDEDLDYITNNCVIIFSSKRKLWKKPTDLEELASCTEITIKELRNLAGYEDELTEPPSEIDIEFIKEDRKRKILEEPVKGRLIKKIRRTGSGFWY